MTRTITRIDAATREVHLDGGDVLRARTIILTCGVAWRRLSVEGVDRLSGKGVFYGATRSEAAATHGLDVHVVGAGNSAGQAAVYFSTHARSVTILCRGENLEKSMSRYLIEQLAARPNISVLHRTEVVAVHGDTSLEAVDVHNAETGETTQLDSGALFIMIGADAETAWLPPEIALDRHGYVLTGSDVRDAGRWELERDPYLLETSVPGHLRERRCQARSREACGRCRRRGEHGDRLRPSVPQGVGGADRTVASIAWGRQQPEPPHTVRTTFPRACPSPRYRSASPISPSS